MEFLDGFKVVEFDPKAYLADRIKRGTAFVAAVWSVGSTTELCLSEHATSPTIQPEVVLEAQPALPFEEVFNTSGR